MERHVQVFLNRVSLIASGIATIILLYILLHPPEACGPHFTPQSFLRFPHSTCDRLHHPRHFSTIEKKNQRLWSTSAWQKKVHCFSSLFLDFHRSHPSRPFSLLSNSSKVLCVLAGAGQEAMALEQIGVSDVTAVDLVDSPPLVSRADPLNLPYFDDEFDFAFSAQFDTVLFPYRFAKEMARTVRVGGFCVLIVEECTHNEVRDIASWFKRGELVDTDKILFSGSKMTRIVVRIINST